MLVCETYEKNGRMLMRHYSDCGFYIARDGVEYVDAVDPLDSGREYVETEHKIEQETSEES